MSEWIEDEGEKDGGRSDWMREGGQGREYV